MTKQEIDRNTESKKDNFDYIKFKCFCAFVQRKSKQITLEEKHMNGRTIFAASFPDKVLASKIFGNWFKRIRIRAIPNRQMVKEYEYKVFKGRNQSYQ